MKNKKIIVIGSGFAGLAFCRSMKNESVSIILIDRRNYHLFQPLLYQVATCALSKNLVSESTRTILAKQKNVETRMDEVSKIDLKEKSVYLKNSEVSLSYDYLVIAAGAVTNYFGNSRWADHAIGLKSLKDALSIRNKILCAYEKAEYCEDPEECKKLLTTVVVGGGPTGVELAGSIAELAHSVFVNDFRHIDTRESRIILVEYAPAVLSMFDPKLSEKARQDLVNLGVEVWTSTMVKDIREGIVETSEGLIEASTIIWGAGVKPSPIIDSLDVPKNRNRVAVALDCSIPNHPDAFVTGDAAYLQDRNGVTVPGVSPGAIQMGKHVAKVLKGEIFKGKKVRPDFSYWDKGSMATIGRNKAIVEIVKIKFANFPAWITWLFVHLVFLVGMNNRFGVFAQWVYAYLRNRRTARIIANENSQI